MVKLSRRDFLKGTAAVAATGLLSSVAFGAEKETGAEEAWDLETEVLILGAGAAGMSAGYEAATAGAKTMILEKSPTFGGTSIRSGGIIQASGTKVQKKLTDYKDDTPEKHAEYYIQEGEGTLDEDLVRDMTEGSASHIEWLESLGLEFIEVTGSAHTPMADEELYADRIHGTAVGANGIFTAVHDAAEEAGVEFVYDTQATKLITDADGKVIGVEALQDGKTIRVRGSKGVIICTSSIDHNEELCKMLNPNMYYDLQNSECASYPYDTGDGIIMAAALGAQLSNFGGVIDLTAVTWAGVNRQTPQMPCFFVNKYGNRFECEDNTYALTSRELWREITKTAHACYTICGPNEKMPKEALDALVEKGQAFTAETIEELAEQIDVDAVNLQWTLDKWNSDMEEYGKDTLFDRATGLEKIEGPYYAIYEGFMNLGAIGGLKINLNCEVQNVLGESIPGLYAAGMASAGWVGPFYPGSGTALLGSIHFGRKAGKIVAEL